MQALLQNFVTLEKPSNENQDPLYRLFHREGMIGQKLLGQVRRDMEDVCKVCEGVLKQTNHLRTLMSSLTKGTILVSFSRMKKKCSLPLLGTIPDHWRRYKVHKSMSVAEWVPNLARRLAQLDHVAGLEGGNLTNIEVWLGGLFFPEAYITATRQAVAHRKRWSLETLQLRIDIERVNDPEAFIVDGTLLLLWSTFQHE